MSNDYYFGNCLVCNKWKALKDGICNWCAEDSVPGFLKNIIKSQPTYTEDDFLEEE